MRFYSLIKVTNLSVFDFIRIENFEVARNKRNRKADSIGKLVEINEKVPDSKCSSSFFFSRKQNRLDFVCRNFGNRIFASEMKINIHVVRNFYSRMQICVNPPRRHTPLKITIIENSFLSNMIVLIILLKNIEGHINIIIRNSPCAFERKH